jgi:hypothetical protein
VGVVNVVCPWATLANKWAASGRRWHWQMQIRQINARGGAPLDWPGIEWINQGPAGEKATIPRWWFDQTGTRCSVGRTEEDQRRNLVRSADAMRIRATLQCRTDHIREATERKRKRDPAAKPSKVGYGGKEEKRENPARQSVLRSSKCPKKKPARKRGQNPPSCRTEFGCYSIHGDSLGSADGRQRGTLVLLAVSAPWATRLGQREQADDDHPST